MPCGWYKAAHGTVMHINHGRGGQKKICSFCHKFYASKLCDYPLGDGKTCDAEMCERCSRTLGYQDTDIGGGMKRLNDTIDVCPNHRGQPSLFGASNATAAK